MINTKKVYPSVTLILPKKKEKGKNLEIRYPVIGVDPVSHIDPD